MHKPIEAARPPSLWQDTLGGTFEQYAAEHGTIVSELEDGRFSATVQVEREFPSSLPSGLNFRWRVFSRGVEEATGCHMIPARCQQLAQEFIFGRRNRRVSVG